MYLVLTDPDDSMSVWILKYAPALPWCHPLALGGGVGGGTSVKVNTEFQCGYNLPSIHLDYVLSSSS